MMLLTDEQLQVLLLNLTATRGEQGITDHEAAKVLTWANHAVAEYAVLELALKGYVSLDVKKGDVVFGLTEKGAREGVTFDTNVN